MEIDKNIIYFNEKELEEIKKWYNELANIYNKYIYTYKYYDKNNMLVNFFTSDELKNFLTSLKKVIDNYKI